MLSMVPPYRTVTPAPRRRSSRDHTVARPLTTRWLTCGAVPFPVSLKLGAPPKSHRHAADRVVDHRVGLARWGTVDPPLGPSGPIPFPRVAVRGLSSEEHGRDRGRVVGPSRDRKRGVGR